MPTLTADPLQEIARLVMARHGVDFRRYKPRCLLRRLNVRMRAVGAPDLESYAGYLRRQPEEVQLLFDALAINFSFFNRDPELFAILGSRVLPELARAFPAGPLRLWSAGCAAGEEIYSVGIAARQVLPPDDCERIHLLGTDIDEAALAEARAGVYPPARVGFLDNSLIGQYFHPVEGGSSLQAREELRRMAKFRRADLLRPAPYRDVAFICCRNVMIYLEPKDQAEAQRHLAAALSPGGVLALGRVERLVGSARPLFEIVDAAGQVFRKRAGTESR